MKKTIAKELHKFVHDIEKNLEEEEDKQRFRRDNAGFMLSNSEALRHNGRLADLIFDELQERNLAEWSGSPTGYLPMWMRALG